MLLVLAVFATAGFACGKSDKADNPPTEESATPDATPATPVAADAAPAAEPLPTAEDFEAEATDDISKDNLEKQLEEIEKELGE